MSEAALWIMIAGPYLAGARTESERAANHRRLNEAAVAVFERGHVPIIGVNLALPIIEAAGRDRFEDIMMPISLAAAQRCDACLRLAGSSSGADQEVQVFRDRGLPVFLSVDEIPRRAS